MATGKKYYWIKLKTDFITSDKVDYLMSQPNGAEYVVLYQMLCMKCINTDGLLARKIGEVIIPFDAEKITRDCKYFKIDTVEKAFSLFIQLGMIYQEENGYLRIADFENMVGSETDWAAQKRNQAKKAVNNTNSKKLLIETSGNTVESSVENFHTEKEIEKEIDIDIERERINSLSGSLSLNSESPKKMVISDSQENYANIIFDLWSKNNLPCWNNNFTSFLQKDFYGALQYIRGYHSDDVIRACKNYINMLRNPNSWIKGEMSFDKFVSSKLFKNCLPDNFRENTFIKNSGSVNTEHRVSSDNLRPEYDDWSDCYHGEDLEGANGTVN